LFQEWVTLLQSENQLLLKHRNSIEVWYSNSGSTEGSESVVLDKLLDVSFEVTSEQLTMDIRDFSEQLLIPAMQGFANKIDHIIGSL
jgi:hypothetical protein